MKMAAALALLACAAAVVPAGAAAQTITMVTDTSLVLDSNKPATEGPQAAYVGFHITGGAGYTGAVATLAISSPGGITFGGSATGAQAASQYLGTLSGDTTVYWYLRYPTVNDVAAALTVTLTSSGGTVTGTGSVKTRPMQSAAAGGNTGGGLLGPGAVIGQVLWFDATYTFGGATSGDVYNLQPSGDFNFNAKCFQLIGSQVTSSGVTAIPANTRNIQFFRAAVAQTGSGFSATMRWWFKYRCSGITSQAIPYASMQSGKDNLKYSANYSAWIGPAFPAASNPFSGAVRKLVTPGIVPPGDTVTYGILIPNAGYPPGSATWATAVDVVVDTLPAGVTYVGPVTVPGTSVVTSVPTITGIAGGATQLTWLGPIPVNAYDTVKVYFRARVPSAQVPASLGRYVNAVSAQVGVQVVGSARDTVQVAPADVRVLKTGPASAVAGDTLRYVVAVWNAGPVRADSVVISDTVPAAVTLVKTTRLPPPTLVGSVLTWAKIPTMAPGDTVRDTVIVTVKGGTTGAITNIAAARAFIVDTILANNNGSAPNGRVSTTIGVAVDVNPQGGLSLRLPGKDSSVFSVTNHSTGSRSYDLFGRGSGAPGFITIDSIRGPGLSGGARPDSARVTLAGNASGNYTVWYTVAVGDTARNTEYLRARSTTPDTLSSGQGWVTVRRVFPKLALDKTVTPATGVPGTDLAYEIIVDNLGEYAARSVTVTDSVPGSLAFKVSSAATTLPPAVTAAVSYSSDGSNWSYVPGSGGCPTPAPAGYDACVRLIRWTLQTDLHAAGLDATARFRFTARIR